jgi:hypothetical protein
MKTKYRYIKVIQQYFGTWEDVSEYKCTSQGLNLEFETEKTASGGIIPNIKKPLIKNDLKEYKLMGYPVRVIRRKELNNN